jgi:predicted dehydrogenase
MKKSDRKTVRTARKTVRRSTRPNRKVRYAVVGLGWISQTSVLPAFARASKNSELVALISSDDKKLAELGARYKVPYLYSADQFEECMESEAVDAVYLALPNSMHRAYTVAAARAGVHVLCEKPLAVTPFECEQMVEACDAAGVQLMTAYRLHFDKANLEAVRIAQSGKLGDLRLFNSAFTMPLQDESNYRMRFNMGGGPLLDLGIYCINAARYVYQNDPVEVTGFNFNANPEKFSEVEESFSGILRFPEDRIANFTCSFGAANTSFFEVIGTEGKLRVDPAFDTAQEIQHTLTVGSREQKRSFPKTDQFAPELLYFSECVQEGRRPEPSGVEGMIDVDIMNALFRSAAEGRSVVLDRYPNKVRPTAEQAMRCRPLARKPLLVHVDAPAA